MPQNETTVGRIDLGPTEPRHMTQTEQRIMDAALRRSVTIRDELLVVENERLRAALAGLLDRYTGLVNCGDCGSWDPETEAPVIAAREALK